MLIAVIGAHWLTSKDEHDSRRLDNPEDFVRKEIGTALKRDIRVIPVLVDGALMPRSTDLPDDLKPLVRRNALRVTDTGFDDDCRRLIVAIEEVLEKTAAEGREPKEKELETSAPVSPPATPTPSALPPPPSPPKRRLMVGAILGGALILALGVFAVTRFGRHGPVVITTTSPTATVQAAPVAVATPTPTPVAQPTSTPNSSREGKLGDELSTHDWTFQARNVRETDEYAERYYQRQRVIRPQGKNDILIIVDARLRNPLQNAQSPVLTERFPGNTGLVDEADHSYQPLDYDARQSIDKIMSGAGAAVLPGQIADFALVFSVPRGSKPKLLVFTLMTYLSEDARTDVKVSLSN